MRGPLALAEEQPGRLRPEQPPIDLHDFLRPFQRVVAGLDLAQSRLAQGRRIPGLTPVGRWLRRLRMDELPQLWNVLIGDMSLVGPRPEWVEEIKVLEKVIPNYHLRHLVKPGITGWAQVYFRATNNFQDSVEKLHYDLYYLKFFSAALDIGILFKTIKRIFVPDSRIRVGLSLAARSTAVKHHWARDFNSATAATTERRRSGRSLLQKGLYMAMTLLQISGDFRRTNY